MIARLLNALLWLIDAMVSTHHMVVTRWACLTRGHDWLQLTGREMCRRCPTER